MASSDNGIENGNQTRAQAQFILAVVAAIAGLLALFVPLFTSLNNCKFDKRFCEIEKNSLTATVDYLRKHRTLVIGTAIVKETVIVPEQYQITVEVPVEVVVTATPKPPPEVRVSVMDAFQTSLRCLEDYVQKPNMTIFDGTNCEHWMKNISNKEGFQDAELLALKDRLVDLTDIEWNLTSIEITSTEENYASVNHEANLITSLILSGEVKCDASENVILENEEFVVEGKVNYEIYHPTEIDEFLSIYSWINTGDIIGNLCYPN